MTWSAITPDGLVEFPLAGDELPVALVRARLSAPVPILVTPTGPSVEPDEADELAVLGALLELYGTRLELAGETPDLTFGAPPDAVF